MCLQLPSLRIENGLVPAMHFFVSHTLPSALESGQEVRIVQVDFSAAVDSVNHRGILYRFGSMSIGGSVLSYKQSSYITDYSTFWWTVVRVSWSTWCQECHR